MMKTDLDQKQSQRAQLLTRTSELANNFLDGVANRPVARRIDFENLRSEIGGHGIQDEGEEPMPIIEELARHGDRAVVATAGPRYFGFVVGGSLPGGRGAAARCWR